MPADPLAQLVRVYEDAELMIFASWMGLCKGVTNTEQPSRNVDVQAAAKVIVSRAPSRGWSPSNCSCVQALTKPRASTRARYSRNLPTSNRSATTVWGIPVANLIVAIHTPYLRATSARQNSPLVSCNRRSLATVQLAGLPY